MIWKRNHPKPRSCRDCAQFIDDAADLERALPGFTILSSAYGSTRGSCGICIPRQLFQDPHAACPDFVPRPSLPAAAGESVTQG